MNSNKFTTYLSPGKLNLGLKVVGQLNDGYHKLKTVFCLIDIFDEISIQIIDNVKVSLIEHNQAWPYQNDLAYRAAIALQEISSSKLGVNIKIKKVIPSGSGMGGGSSNAATVLLVLNKLWEINLSKDELIKLGKTLGADVPFFVYGQNAYATGIGEILTPVELNQQYFVIVKPSFHIPTKNIFSNLKINFDNIEEKKITPKSLISTQENDLFPIALKLYPQLKAIVEHLQRFGNVAMTGSGSAVFLTFTNEDEAKKVAKLIRNSYNSYLVKMLSKSPIF
ncbi:MAG: 4-(cytidine 5'-diphospho)-2-C-methyl-D-erythritol kinase [Neisseriaceae bacterium]